MFDFWINPPAPEQKEQIVSFMLALSVFFLFLPLLRLIYKTACYYLSKKKSKKMTMNSLLLWASICLVLSVACLRFCTFMHNNDANETISELIANSILHGLKALAVDDDFVDLLMNGKDMIDEVFPNNAYILNGYSFLFGLTNILTPVFGGAYVFNMLIKFFPKLRLRFSFFKKKYFFSELNDRSLALASSIAKQKRGFLHRRPLLVFTDTYVDEDSEKSNELYQAAKRIGAVCISDDIVHYHVPSMGEKWFFLMDENEIDNIHALAAFAAEAKTAHIKGSRVFVFYQNDAYALTEKRILDNLDNAIYDKYKRRINKRVQLRYEKWLEEYRVEQRALWNADPKNAGKSDADFELWLRNKKAVTEQKADYRKEEIAPYSPVVTRVRDFENLIFLLLREIPLFTPLLLNEVRRNTAEKIPSESGVPAAQAENDDTEEIKTDSKNDEPAFSLKTLLTALKAKLTAKTTPTATQPTETAVKKAEEDEQEKPTATPVDVIKPEEAVETPLNVTILGGGKIGMQMLLSASWCGQMFGHTLGLNMISNEKRRDVQKHIEQISPEFLKSTVPSSDLLRIYSDKEEYSPPYFTFRYAQADLTTQDFSDISCKAFNGDSMHSMLESDYYLVALGSDEQNIATAELLARKIAIHHKKKQIDKDVVIVMMIYDPKICTLFAKDPGKSEFSEKHIHIHAYGSLDSNYSIENLSLILDNARAIAKNKNYAAVTGKNLPVQRIRQKDVYNAWSSLANAFHYKYRMYSAYRFLQARKESALSPLGDIMAFEDAYIKAIARKPKSEQSNTNDFKKQSKHPFAEKVFAWFKSWPSVAALLDWVGKKPADDKPKNNDATTTQPALSIATETMQVEENYYNQPLASYLAWLEHRRWTAYLRSCGFISTVDPPNEGKQMALKMHNCLVEADHRPYCKTWYDTHTTPADCANCAYRTGCAALKTDYDKLEETGNVFGRTKDRSYKINDFPTDVATEKLQKKTFKEKTKRFLKHLFAPHKNTGKHS